MSLKRTTAHSIKWVLVASLVRRITTMCTTIVVARILDPAAFGLFALAYVVLDGLGLFKSMGFDSALIQRKEEIDKAANTAFIIIPFLGCIIYAVLFFLSPVFSHLLQSAELTPILRTLGLIYIFNCFSLVPSVLLEKRMQFGLLTAIGVVILVINSVSVISFAVLGYGVWSLVYGSVIQTFLRLVSMLIFSRWNFRLEFDKRIAREMFHFGKFLFLGSLLWYLKMSFDKAIVGSLLGPSMLGLYAIAYNFANLGNEYFGGKISKVLFPAYSKIQDNLYDLRNGFSKILKYIGAFAFPFALGLFLLGGDFLQLAFGQKWLGAIPILKILAWSSLFGAFPICIKPVFLALGRPKTDFSISFTQVMLFFLFIIPMAKIYGVVGVGFVVCFSSFTVMLLNFFFVKKFLKMKISQIFTSLIPGFVATGIMSLGIIGIRKIILSFWGLDFLSWSLIPISIFAVCLYVIVLCKQDKNILSELKELFV